MLEWLHLDQAGCLQDIPGCLSLHHRAVCLLQRHQDQVLADRHHPNEVTSLHSNGSSGHPKIGKRVSSISTHIKDLWPAQPVRCVCVQLHVPPLLARAGHPHQQQEEAVLLDPGGLHHHSRILLPVGFHRHLRFP